MKQLFLMFVFAASSLTAAEKRVPMPADSGKLYVSLYVADQSQVPALNEKVASYRAGNHYNVYLQSNPMFSARFAGVPVPSAFVQKSDGTVVYASCPWRKPKPEPVTPEPEPVVEPTPPYEPAAPASELPLYLGIVGVGLAVGAGSKFVQELKGK